MADEERARKWVVLLSRLLFPFDMLLGLGLYFLAGTVQEILQIDQAGGLAFIRMAGVFTFFLGYLYYLVQRDSSRRLVLFQVTSVLRAVLTLSHFYEAWLLGGGSDNLAPIFFYAMSFLDLVVCAVQITLLRKLNRRWLLL